MLDVSNLPGLLVDSEWCGPAADNFRPVSWPPTDDFPIVIDAQGEVISRYGDATWVLTPWVGKSLVISFGVGVSGRGAPICEENAGLLRQLAAWWLYGPDGVRVASTLAQRVNAIKPLFVVCSECGIRASELSRYPAVIAQVAKRLPKSEGRKCVARLNDLRTFSEELGFEILDSAGLRELSSNLSNHESVQTAYIPPRIWTYQVLRLREVLDDYLAHKKEIEACYRFCLDAYRTNLRGGARFRKGRDAYCMPFASYVPAGHASKGRKYYGRFRLTAERFGIDRVLDRWVDTRDRAGVRSLTSFLSLVSAVGLAYVMNFSLMRADEAMQLRSGCYNIERDSLGDDIHLVGDIHTLSGVTTKTMQDDDARWIVSPSCGAAIEAMESVARLRGLAEARGLKPDPSKGAGGNPLLQPWAREPWSHSTTTYPATRKRVRSYGDMIRDYPKLFDGNELRIREDDLSIARRLTFGLDPNIFEVGRTWPLAWHQLRRTGACNMLSTGLVSDASLQYQLKHVTRACTRYYGQNHYKLISRLDEDTRALFLREMYSAVVIDLQSIKRENMCAPLGEKRKAQLIAEISSKDHAGLLRDAEAGRVSYRQTFLGGCAKPGAACALGGISNITGCLGYGKEKACEWALVDKRKRPAMARLLRIFRDQLSNAPTGSALQLSIKASIESVERAINVVDMS